ncbi:MAG: hypothetical protein ACI9MC_001411 [Kiritimatiellia bacterium]|jgi:hypothetical protein
MLTTLMRTAKTARQATMAAGMTLAVFSLPLLMAGGGGSYFTGSDAQNAQLMGTGNDDPVVYMADVQTLLSRSEVDATEDAGKDSSENKSSKSADVEPGGGPGVVATSKVGRAFGPRGQQVSRERVVPDMSNKRRMAATRNLARGTSRCATPAEGIDHIGGENYKMHRTLIQHYTGNVRAAMGLAAVAWHKDSRGRKDGFQVGRIRCGTPLAQVGILNGDVIHAINGKKVRSIPAAFTAVRRVTRNEFVVVDITRGGRRIRKTVRVI